MISFEIYNKIHFLLREKGMSCAGISLLLHLSPTTVKKWAAMDHYVSRKTVPRDSKLGPFKTAIRRIIKDMGEKTVSIRLQPQQQLQGPEFSMTRYRARQQKLTADAKSRTADA